MGDRWIRKTGRGEEGRQEGESGGTKMGKNIPYKFEITNIF